MATQQNNSGMPDWLAQALGIGGGLGTAAGGLFNLFGNKGKNPADAANKYLDQIPGMTGQYYQPYQTAGADAMNTLKGQYGDLLSGDVQNKLGESYKQSPGYARALQEALGAGSNAAAAGGMLGTPAHEEQNMSLAQDLAAKDYDKYIQNQLGLYGLGLGGEEGINKMGFEANKSYADMLAQIQGQKAANAYSGQAGQNAADSNSWGDIFKGLGMGAGAFFGGPAGAAAGGAIGNWFK